MHFHWLGKSNRRVARVCINPIKLNGRVFEWMSSINLVIKLFNAKTWPQKNAQFNIILIWTVFFAMRSGQPCIMKRLLFRSISFVIHFQLKLAFCFLFIWISYWYDGRTIVANEIEIGRMFVGAKTSTQIVRMSFNLKIVEKCSIIDFTLRNHLIGFSSSVLPVHRLKHGFLHFFSILKQAG